MTPEQEQEILDALDHITPETDHDQWVRVGMALHYEGFSFDVFDQWSARDGREGQYSHSNCLATWRSFHADTAHPVTRASIFRRALDEGWIPERGRAALWTETVDTVSLAMPVTSPYFDDTTPLTSCRPPISPKDVDPVPVPTGAAEEPAIEFVDYLEALYRADEHVGICARSTDASMGQDGKWHPASTGVYDMTREEVICRLNELGGDLTRLFGSVNAQAGAWIHINPLDGGGVRDSNVIDYRYALVESDELEPGLQLAIIRKLRLPCAAIVSSAGKSIHAVVHIDAMSEEEYRGRVKQLYEYCNDNGLHVDRQNRNPSRLTRLPGFQRGDAWQRLIEVAGPNDFHSWDEWRDWLVGFPSIVNIAQIANNLPSLRPELIHGVLRDGHKMMLTGPSKAGKSYALIELSCCIALGRPWLGHQCEQGRVLYINMEIDPASFYHRIVNVERSFSSGQGSQSLLGPGCSMPDLADYEETDAEVALHLPNLDAWCLRGHTAPINQLVGRLIASVKKRPGGYRAIIVDPIYKVLPGDENSATDMSILCNALDEMAGALECSIIYAHHFAKGAFASKDVADRASGSGVFARDPDAIAVMSPLDLTDEELPYFAALDYVPSAFRVEYVLREFMSPEPMDIFFRWPLHIVDEAGWLSHCAVRGGRRIEEIDERHGDKKEDTSRRDAEDSSNAWMRRNDLVREAVEAMEYTSVPASITNVLSWLLSNYPEECAELKINKRTLQQWSSQKDADGRRKFWQFEFVKDPTRSGVLVPVTDEYPKA